MRDINKIYKILERHKLECSRFWATVGLLRELGIDTPEEIENARPIYCSAETGLCILINGKWTSI